VPSEIDAISGGSDRRTRKRESRREALLELAAHIVEQVGPEGLSMAALAEAADYATASLYTYFPSRSALLAALQVRALEVLGGVADTQLASWDDELRGRRRVSPVDASLARLLAFSHLFLTAPLHHPREFRLQQRMLVTPGVESTTDAATVVPAALAVLAAPRRLLAAAVEAGGLRPAETSAGDLDGDTARTLAWIVALNGALLVDEISIGVATTGVWLGTELTLTLLTGWGAPPLDTAQAVANSLSMLRP
jgi:AcrR family transcriptional regulator